MPVETNDIQLSNDAKGIGKALRIVAGDNIDLAFSEDADFPNIKTVTVNSTGGGGGGDLLVKHNDITIGTQPSINFIDSSSIEYLVTNDVPNEHVDVQVNYIGTTGLTQQQVEGII